MVEDWKWNCNSIQDVAGMRPGNLNTRVFIVTQRSVSRIISGAWDLRRCPRVHKAAKTKVKHRSAVATKEREHIPTWTGHVARGHQCESVKQEADGHGLRKGDGAGTVGSGTATGRRAGGCWHEAADKRPSSRPLGCSQDRRQTASKTHNTSFDNHTKVQCVAWACVCVCGMCVCCPQHCETRSKCTPHCS